MHSYAYKVGIIIALGFLELHELILGLFGYRYHNAFCFSFANSVNVHYLEKF